MDGDNPQGTPAYLFKNICSSCVVDQPSNRRDPHLCASPWGFAGDGARRSRQDLLAAFRCFTHGAPGTTTTSKPQKKKYQDTSPVFRTTPLSQVIHSRDKPKPRDICGNYVLFSNQFLINLKKCSGDIMGYLPKENCDAGSVRQTKSCKELGKCPRTSVKGKLSIAKLTPSICSDSQRLEQIVIVTVHPLQMTSMIPGLLNPDLEIVALGLLQASSLVFILKL